MDLNRIFPVFQKLTHLSHRYRNFQEFLGDVLEGDRSFLGAEGDTQPQNAPFEINSNIEGLWLEHERQREKKARRPETVFSGLAPFFEAGFLLERSMVGGDNKPRYKMRAMFILGRVFTASTQDDQEIELPLPNLSRHHVYRGKLRPVLRAFDLSSIQDLPSFRHASVFAFSPGTEPRLAFLLVCNRPHPWQIGIVEKAYGTVEELLRAPHTAPVSSRKESPEGPKK